jgi:hypothetical protein
MPQLVGSACGVCRGRIESVLDAVFCADCTHPVHRDCSRPGLGDPASGICAGCGRAVPRRAPLDPAEFVRRIERRLCPRPYSRAVADRPPGCDLLLVRRSLGLARYALAVFRWDPGQDGIAQREAARRGVGERLRAFPVIGEVGVYLVFTGPRRAWVGQVPKVVADQIGGPRRVIVQAVHLVDPATGESSLSRSQWGPIRFGGVGSVAELINTALANTGAAEPAPAPDTGRANG